MAVPACTLALATGVPGAALSVMKPLSVPVRTRVKSFCRFAPLGIPNVAVPST